MSFQAPHPPTELERGKRWYAVQVEARYEAKVRDAIRARMRRAGLEDKLGDIFVPTAPISLPGYVFVELELDDATRRVVEGTPRVRSFVDGRSPRPVAASEIESMRRMVEKGVVERKPRAVFRQGDRIRILEGPFADFTGTVEEVYDSKQKLRVKVMLFGRATPIELDMVAVEKAECRLVARRRRPAARLVCDGWPRRTRIARTAVTPSSRVRRSRGRAGRARRSPT